MASVVFKLTHIKCAIFPLWVKKERVERSAGLTDWRSQMVVKPHTVACVVALGLLLAVPVAAQSHQHYVVLRVWSEGPGPLNSVVLALSSGKQVTVPASDVVRNLTPQVIESVNNATARSPTPATPITSREVTLVELSRLAATALGETETKIQEECGAALGADFSAREECVQRQREAVASLQTRPMTTTNERAIRSQCASYWVNDFRMRDTCETRQLRPNVPQPE